MEKYKEAIKLVLEKGEDRLDRTGVGIRSLFGHQIRFNLNDGFPAVTTKKLAWKAVVSELLWFLEGSNNERRLAEILYRDSAENLKNKKTIWTANANSDYWVEKSKFSGDIGRGYGVQWRSWKNYKNETTDQIKNLISNIKKDPYSRRHLVVSYNPGETTEMALPPCHTMFQMDVSTSGRLSCLMFQRSQDLLLGAPFNYASYALLTHMIAQVCGLQVGELIVSVGSIHIYKNHIEGAQEQLIRSPYPLPTLKLNPDIKSIDEFTMDDIELIGYQHHPAIPLDMAV